MSVTRLKEKRDAGFTLIELLIVIVILGILAAIVVFSVGGITNRGSRSACEANVETVNIASEAYRTTVTTGYAATIPALQTAGFLKTIPGTLDAGGLFFTVTPGGGSQYRITYAPATGLATATSGPTYATAGCPTGN
jgi:prepilin-type N-terminal cleavage/methylation domain-containing protein